MILSLKPFCAVQYRKQKVCLSFILRLFLTSRSGSTARMAYLSEPSASFNEQLVSLELFNGNPDSYYLIRVFIYICEPCHSYTNLRHLVVHLDTTVNIN